MSKLRLYIEAYPISEARISGIGHMTLELIRALERHPENQKSFEIVLVINKDRLAPLKRWKFKTVVYKTIPIPTRPFNILWKFNLLPPIDLFLGKGVYLFPNYKNWRLIKSLSLTFVCDVSYIVVPQFVSPKNQKFLKKNINRWIKRADRILTISHSAQQEIVRYLHVPKEKTILVPCGVDTSVFYKREAGEVEGLKYKCGIESKYILYIGNIEPRKNISRLIDAYKMLPANLRSKYWLVLVGGGGWLNEPIMGMIKKARVEGFNIYKPEIYVPEEDLPALHSGATILVHPALYEGFGISLLQSMACQTPVITANNSSLPEVAGEAALLVDAENVRDISDKMERLLTDEELQACLVEKGMEQVLKYSWDKSAAIIVTSVLGKTK